jgi:hypothetical protein
MITRVGFWQKHLVRVSAMAVALAAPLGAASAQEEPIPTLIDGETGEAYDPEDDDKDASYDGPLFLALFGDSISMATMADAKFGNPGPRFYADFIRSASTAALYDATIGRVRPRPDEDEQHMLMQRHFGNMARIGLSPYLGTQSYSLPVLIKDETGFAPKIYNGAQMAGSYYFSHLYLEKFASFFAKHPFHKKPEIIFANFNGMDFMAGRGLGVFTDKVRGFYQGLAALAPHSTIVVSELGDPVPLMTHPDRVAVERGPRGPLKCSDLYKLVRLDNASGLNPSSTQAEIDAARSQLTRMRGVLRLEVEMMNNRIGPYKEFQGRAVYMASASSGEVGASHVAADCIHPDVYLQTVIGINLWQVVKPLL